MNKTILTTAVVSAVTGGVLGGIVTYVTVNKALRTRYEDWANEEIDSVKRRYALIRKEDGDLTILEMAQNPSKEVQEAVAKGKELVAQLGYSGFSDEVIEKKVDAAVAKQADEGLSIYDRQEVIDLNKEDDEGDDEDVVDEYEILDGEPYKITEEEYFENEPGYTLDTLTYYEQDDTLCDEHNSQIDSVDATIGERHLHMFHRDARGNGKTSIYIRNDEHQTLYEVILVNNSYGAVVMGLDDETLGLKEPKAKPGRMPRDAD